MKRGLAERSEVWGSLKDLLPLIAFGNLSPLYEEGGFPLRRGFGRTESSAPTRSIAEFQRARIAAIRVSTSSSVVAQLVQKRAMRNPSAVRPSSSNVNSRPSVSACASVRQTNC